jgi:hypothetical protein
MGHIYRAMPEKSGAPASRLGWLPDDVPILRRAISGLGARHTEYQKTRDRRVSGVLIFETSFPN